MNILRLLVRREIISIAISLLIMVLGIHAINNMAIRLYPKITHPVIHVSTSYTGATADVIQGLITSRIESAITGIDNIEYIESTSARGSSDVRIMLTPNTNVQKTMLDVIQKVNQVKAWLPQAVRDPDVTSDGDDRNTMFIGFITEKMSKIQATEYIRRVVVAELQLIKGVAEATVNGPTYVLSIKLNPKLLLAYQLTPNDVINALHQQNVVTQTGKLEGNNLDYTLDPKSNFDDPNQFNNLIIKQTAQGTIRLQDVGHAAFEAEGDQINEYYNGKPVVTIGIKPLPGANPLHVSQAIQSALAKTARSLPYDMRSVIIYNAADYIQNSIYEVIVTLAIALVVVLLVLIFFLGDLSTVLIPLVTIPVSIIGGFLLLHSVGYSINTLTMLAMVLAVGLVVDDAIVVVENIHRFLQKKMSPEDATIFGTMEVFTAVISMTLTLVAVFAPIFFMGGMTGALFSQFAFALIASILFSGVLALTLTPMMCHKLLKAEHHQSRLARFSENIMQRLLGYYQRLLERALNKRKLAILFWLCTIMGGFYLYQHCNQELAPKEDIGYLFVQGSGPDTANDQYVKQYIPAIEKALTSVSGLQGVLLLQGIPALNQFMALDIFKPWDQRKHSTMQMQAVLQKALNKIPAVNASAILFSALPGSSDSAFQMVIQSNGSYRQLKTAAERFEKAAMASHLFLYINDNLSFHTPQIALNINRQALDAHFVDMLSVSNALGVLTGGIDAPMQFNYFGQSYDVIVSAYKKYRNNPDDLDLFTVRNTHQQLIPLSSLLTTDVEVSPASLYDFQKQHAVKVSGVIAPGHTLSQAIDFINQTADQVLPAAMHFDFSGETRRFLQEGDRFTQTFILALIIITLILAIQFNSFKDAMLIILGSVPMALFAALVPLKFGLGTINIYTQIALLTLVGLIAKHGVLMTKFANQLQADGKSIPEAIRMAAIIRFRPILMTTCAMVFGALPLVFADGAGAISRFQMGLTISLGLTIGTICTLFIFPVLYEIFSSSKNKEKYGQ